MLVYILLIVVLIFEAFLFSLKWKSYDKLFLFVAYIEIVFIAGFRVPVSDASDTYAYCQQFLEIANCKQIFEIFSFGYEFGFSFFCWIISRFSRNPQSLIFISSAFMIGLVFFYIKNKSKIAWLSVMLFILSMQFFNFQNLMRFSIAVSILLLSNDYIIKGDFWRFLICVILATSFHFMAIVYIVTFFIYKININIRNLILLTIPFVLLSYYFIDAYSLLVSINPKYISYYDNIDGFYQSSIANTLIFFVNLGVFLFIIIKEEKMLGLRNENKLFFIAAYMSLVFSFMAIDIMMITRFVSLFSLCSIIYIPNLLQKNRRTSNYYMWIFIFLFLGLAQVVVQLHYRPEWFLVTPYKNYLFN